jgi:hypothetical protein
VRGTSASIPESAAPGHMAPAPRFLSTVSLGVSGLYLSGSPGAPPLPITWRRVEDEADSTCLHVSTMERLLHKMLASVHLNILRLVWVSLKSETKSCPHFHGLHHIFSFLICFVSVAHVPGQLICASVPHGGESGVGNSCHCRGHLCHGNADHRDFCLGRYCGTYSATIRVKDAKD